MQRRRTLIVVFIAMLAGHSVALAQVDEVWVARYDGPGRGVDTARAVALDSEGGIYVTGVSWGGSADSTGSTGNAQVCTGRDFATVKYDPNGVVLWADRYCGPEGTETRDEAFDIEVGPHGSVYVAGTSTGPFTGWDFAVVKYASDGERLWVARYDGPARGSDKCVALAVDASGNALVTGPSRGAGEYADFATVKFSSSGEFLWDARYAGTTGGPDWPQDIAVDPDGNVYVTGCRDALGAMDYTTIKYTPDGTQEWLAAYSGTSTGDDMPYDIALDPTGNVYVAGWSDGPGTGPDYLTIKYDAEGSEQWVARYDGGPYFDSDYAHDMTVDASGNVYVTGHSQISYLGLDYTTLKYDTDGELLWERRYGGGGFSYLGDVAYSIAVDDLGNVYVTGKNDGYADYDCATLKYGPNGDELWSAVYQAAEGDEGVGLDIAVNSWGEVYVVGGCDGAGSSEDFITIKYSDGTGVPSDAETDQAVYLSAASPNPFSSSTSLAVVTLGEARPVIVDVCNVRGQVVRRLDASPTAQSPCSVTWDGTDASDTPVSSGVYFIRAAGGGSEAVRKVVYVR